jgi:hypothetical protein
MRVALRQILDRYQIVLRPRAEEPHRLGALGQNVPKTFAARYLPQQARSKLDANYHIRLRWVGPTGQVWWQDYGAHPVSGYNPTGAWQPGEIIADAMDKVGKDGVVTAEESNGIKFETEYVEGMKFDRGYVSPYLSPMLREWKL